MRSYLICRHIISWSVKQNNWIAVSQCHREGLKFHRLFLGPTSCKLLKLPVIKVCTWCIITRRNAKKVGIYWQSNQAHSWEYHAVQGNKCCCICLVGWWLVFFFFFFFYRFYSVKSKLRFWFIWNASVIISVKPSILLFGNFSDTVLVGYLEFAFMRACIESMC